MSRMSLYVAAVLVVLWWAAGTLGRALPPTQVVIQAGPRGGSFDLHARHYAELLSARGFEVAVRNQDDSLRIIDRLDDPASGVHIGFTAQRVDPAQHPAVVSMGVVELQPLFLFLRRGADAPATPAGLAGQRLVMPPRGSATAQATLDLLSRYGVSMDNARFSFLPIGEAADALTRGEQDAGFFMLAPDNPLVRRLASDPGLVPYSLSDGAGISRQIDYLKPATLVRGALDLRRPLPAVDVALVGAAVNVVTRADIHPAVMYALLQAMNRVHKVQTLVSEAGDYPRQTGTVLPMHPLAQEWSRNGTPWLYARLPPSLAGLIDAYWGPTLALLALVSAFGSLQSVGGFVNTVSFGVALQGLGWLQRRIDRGGAPGRSGRWLFDLAEPVVLRQGKEQLARERLERLRPHLRHPGAATPERLEGTGTSASAGASADASPTATATGSGGASAVPAIGHEADAPVGAHAGAVATVGVGAAAGTIVGAALAVRAVQAPES